MTAQEIVDAALKGGKPLTPARVAKAKKLCERMKVPVEDVIALLPLEEQEKFSAAHN